MKVTPIITKPISKYRAVQTESRPVSPFENNLNEDTNLSEEITTKQFEMETIKQQTISNTALNENDLVNVNISILTDYNNVNNIEATNNRNNNNKEENTILPKTEGGFYSNIPNDLVFENSTYDTDGTKYDSLKKIKRTEKCIKRIIFFLILVFFCSVLYILLHDLISFE